MRSATAGRHRPVPLIARRPRGVAGDFALRVGPLYASFARQRYDREALDALFAIAEHVDLAGAMRRLLDGDMVNPTEGRAALHTALRGDSSASAVARDAQAQALDARERMRMLVAGLEDTNVTDIVSVGIGGSDLGPRLIVDALALTGAPAPGKTRPRVHFISNVDGNAAQRVLASLDPARPPHRHFQDLRHQEPCSTAAIGRQC